MSLDTYANLKSSILDWMARSDLSGNTAEWVTLAEARLNRELPAIETDATLTGVAASRVIDVSSISIVEPIALYMDDPSISDEIEITKQTRFAETTTSGTPVYWEYDANAAEIRFDKPLGGAYSFRFRYRQRFALSDSVTTNWLLTNHPDVYLAACVVWGSAFTEKLPAAAAFKSLLDESIPSIRNTITQGKRGRATVDPMLQTIGRRYYYQGEF